jgi:hypothetical protein
MLLIRQPMVLPPASSIAPDIKTALRGAERLSMKHRYTKTLEIDKGDNCASGVIGVICFTFEWQGVC